MAFDPGSGGLTCPACGTTARAGAAFCPGCGRPLDDVQAASVPMAVPPPPPPASVPPQGSMPPQGYTPPEAYAPPPPPPGYGPPPGNVPPPGYVPPQTYAPPAAPTMAPLQPYTPPPARGSSRAAIAAIGLVAILAIAGAVVVMKPFDGSGGSASPSTIAAATPTRTPTSTRTATPTSRVTPSPRVTPTPRPTRTPTPTEFGTSWQVFYDYQSAAMDVHRADTKAWNDATTPTTTAAAVKTAKAHAEADLAWLQAQTPLPCYKVLYDDLVAYDNAVIKLMNDWLAGKYTTITKTDIPAVNAIWNRLADEFDEADATCG